MRKRPHTYLNSTRIVLKLLKAHEGHALKQTAPLQKTESTRKAYEHAHRHASVLEPNKSCQSKCIIVWLRLGLSAASAPNVSAQVGEEFVEETGNDLPRHSK